MDAAEPRSRTAIRIAGAVRARGAALCAAHAANAAKWRTIVTRRRARSASVQTLICRGVIPTNLVQPSDYGVVTIGTHSRVVAAGFVARFCHSPPLMGPPRRQGRGARWKARTTVTKKSTRRRCASSGREGAAAPGGSRPGCFWLRALARVGVLFLDRGLGRRSAGLDARLESWSV